MPTPATPKVPDGFVTRESLATFVLSKGYHPPLANRLFNLLLRWLMHDLKQYHGVELDVRYVASPEVRWPRNASEVTNETVERAGLMISVSSLREAARHLYPNYTRQYGKTHDDLLKAWVESLP